ncbi:MAG: multicopper oxidase domain-containing protein, partial [Zavarzinia sp.]|nr:multicopper oxidase domain-containing protein [Zavarzinia sp.]
MTRLLSRRHFLASAAALSAAPFIAASPLGAGMARAGQARELFVERRTLEVRGRPASVFGLRRADGGSGLVLDPGEAFRLRLHNRLDVETIVHWHGQTPPPDQDGVTNTGYVAPIAAGTAADYDFVARPGTHWMHSHHVLQERNLLAAPLIVRSAADAALDAQEVTLLLHDFSFRSPEEILAGLGGAMGHGDMGHGATDDGA